MAQLQDNSARQSAAPHWLDVGRWIVGQCEQTIASNVFFVFSEVEPDVRYRFHVTCDLLRRDGTEWFSYKTVCFTKPSIPFSRNVKRRALAAAENALRLFLQNPPAPWPHPWKPNWLLAPDDVTSNPAWITGVVAGSDQHPGRRVLSVEESFLVSLSEESEWGSPPITYFSCDPDLVDEAFDDDMRSFDDTAVARQTASDFEKRFVDLPRWLVGQSPATWNSNIFYGVSLSAGHLIFPLEVTAYPPRSDHYEVRFCPELLPVSYPPGLDRDGWGKQAAEQLHQLLRRLPLNWTPQTLFDPNLLAEYVEHRFPKYIIGDTAQTFSKHRECYLFHAHEPRFIFTNQEDAGAAAPTARWLDSVPRKRWLDQVFDARPTGLRARVKHAISNYESIF